MAAPEPRGRNGTLAEVPRMATTAGVEKKAERANVCVQGQDKFGSRTTGVNAHRKRPCCLSQSVRQCLTTVSETSTPETQDEVGNHAGGAILKMGNMELTFLVRFR